jgi:hypothetical protein
MSRATISGGGADGFYTIVLYPDNSKIDEKINHLNEEVDKLEQDIANKQAEVDELGDDLGPLRDAVDDAIHNLEIAADNLGDNATKYITKNISAVNSAISNLSAKGTPSYSSMIVITDINGNRVKTLNDNLAAKDTGGSLSDEIAELEARSDALIAKAASNDAEFTDGITASINASSALQDAVTAKEPTVSGERFDLVLTIGDVEVNTSAGIWEMYDRTDTLEAAMSDLISGIRGVDPQWEVDLTDEIAAVNTSIDDLRSAINYGDDSLTDEIANVKSAMDTLNTSINVRDGKPTDEVEAANKAVLELAKASKEWHQELYNLQILKAQKLSKEKKIETLELAKLPEDEVAAWCADYSESLSGDVGIIEVDGQTLENPIIQPGYSGAAAYSKSRDGCLQSPYSLTPSSAFVNWAVFPGWQKWRPTYMIGEITSIDYDADTCSVTIARSYSNCQSGGIASLLPTNYKDSYDDVPITYMSCNADAFEVGDNVVVKFQGQDKDSPVVIGFVDNPVECIQRIAGIYAVIDDYPLDPLTAAQAAIEFESLRRDGLESEYPFFFLNSYFLEITCLINGDSRVMSRHGSSSPYYAYYADASFAGEFAVYLYWTGYGSTFCKDISGSDCIRLRIEVHSVHATTLPEIMFTIKDTQPGHDESLTEFSVTPGPIDSNSATYWNSANSKIFKLADGGGITEG